MSVEELALSLPRPEKWKLMEALWEDLSHFPDEIASPGWHEAALRETQQRVDAGEETILDWSDAERSLQQRR